MSSAFIIQARLKSTRLPNKVILPFFENKSILDLIIDKLRQFSIPIILAVPLANDKRLVDYAMKKGIPCFEGDEDNVVQRFIDTAQAFGIENIFRICSDNPFISISLLKELINHSADEHLDYTCFEYAHTSAIKSHLGFYAEYVSRKALNRVRNEAKENIFLEHVTNYVYENPNKFNIRLLENPIEQFSNHSKIRLTIDTKEDFEILSKIYNDLFNMHGENFDYDNVLEYLKDNTHWLNSMSKEKNRHSK